MLSTDVAIIGAGPIGIEMAVALKEARIDYLHFDAGQIGATMFWWPPGTRWFSSNDRIAIAGVPLQTVDQNKSTREEYLRYLRTIVLQFDLAIRAYEPVVGVERTAVGFVLTTNPHGGRQTYRAKRIILATGGTARPRQLGIDGEELPHVSHNMEDPHKYFQRRVLIVGGRNSAVEAALRIHQVGGHVTLAYRRGELDARSIKYWLYPEITGLMKSGRITAYFNTIVTQITPSAATLARCDPETFRAMPVDRAPQVINVEADFILMLVGYVADMSLARLSGVELRGASEVPVFDEQTMQTNVPGIYIAGTAIGGTQDHYQVFLENCHVHVGRIVAALTGTPPPKAKEEPALPES